MPKIGGQKRSFALSSRNRPKTFVEWVLGRSIPKASPAPDPPSSPEKRRFTLEIVADGQTQTDNTVPGTSSREGQHAGGGAEPDVVTPRKVSFQETSDSASKKTSATEGVKDAASSSKAPTNGKMTSDHGDTGNKKQQGKSPGHGHCMRFHTSPGPSKIEACFCATCCAGEQNQSKASIELIDAHGEVSSTGRISVEKVRRSLSSTLNSLLGETSEEYFASCDTESSSQKINNLTAKRLSKFPIHHFKSKQVSPEKSASDPKSKGKEPIVNVAEQQHQKNGLTPMKSVGIPEQDQKPRPRFVKPKPLTLVGTQASKIERTLGKPDDARPNTFYDVSGGNVNVYYGPVYKDTADPVSPGQNNKTQAGMAAAVPPPQNQPYCEAPHQENILPNPSAPLWGVQPAATLPAPFPPMVPFGPLLSPCYNLADEKTASGDTYSGTTKVMDTNAGPISQAKQLDKGKKSALAQQVAEKALPKAYQKPFETIHDNRGPEHNPGVDSNNNAADIFACDAEGSGWGRSAWKVPKPSKSNGKTKTNGDYWGNYDQNDNNFVNNESNNNNNWGTGNGGHNWGGLNISDGNWHTGNNADTWGNWNSNQNGGDNSNTAAHDGSTTWANWSYKNSHGSNQKENNAAYKNYYGSRDARHGTHHENENLFLSHDHVSRKMPGAWDEVLPEWKRTTAGIAQRDEKHQPRSNQRRYGHTQHHANNPTANDAVPSWGDLTAAQSSKDPSAWELNARAGGSGRKA
ncbi:hypothetical protein SPI_00204 [Niveomyces insectorum RCEF 264]|uniref:Uncharacterized protein n=1 Tax=Niveomyces insectorum RCEF 264 TaxID=1081102 RepID=A0A167ZXG9_9HYPO|nr:hypothetical protein SPI_00204 [Niveomyces insectorum RCEF 264]